MRGRTHFDKLTKTDIPTPHVQVSPKVKTPDGRFFPLKKKEEVYSATKVDIRLARKLANKQGGFAMNADVINYIQTWYSSKCDGNWEHSYGLDISNIDNPGWKVKINGEHGKKPMTNGYENDENDWIDITATESDFIGYGGVDKLNDILISACTWLSGK